MEFTWSERKRALNLKDHGLDFVDAASVFEGLTFTFEDDRFSYGEQRFITLGLLAGIPVSIAHTEDDNEIRVISFRKATNREAKIYASEIQNCLGSLAIQSCRSQARRRASRGRCQAHCSRYGATRLATAGTESCNLVARR